MTAQQPECPRCGEIVQDAGRDCESCGSGSPTPSRVAVPRSGQHVDGRCSDCGKGRYVDGYCNSCGLEPEPPNRDQAVLAGIALITDRGLKRARNEDAAAAGVVADTVTGQPSAMAVAVCDGVSSSGDAHTASIAASVAGVNAMCDVLAGSPDVRKAVLAGLADAAKAAAAARSDLSSDPSCTYTAAAVVPTQADEVEIAVGNVGDSRMYWVPEPPAPAERLTVDDSLAQRLLRGGADADSEAVQRGTYVLTRWLGADAELNSGWESSVRTLTVGPGSLLMCTDGLWNYLPDDAEIARHCTGTDARTTARELTEYALRAGGEDNITVAIIPLGRTHELG